MSKQKKVKYVSKFLQLRLVNKSSYTKEVEGKIVVVGGSGIQFENGFYETDIPGEIEFLENHPNFGSVFIKISGKDKDPEGTRDDRNKTLSDKKQEEDVKVEEKKQENKKLGKEEGSKISRKRGKGSKTKGNKKGKGKVEKPAF